jgi:hypothetical protein
MHYDSFVHRGSFCTISTLERVTNDETPPPHICYLRRALRRRRRFAVVSLNARHDQPSVGNFCLACSAVRPLDTLHP